LGARPSFRHQRFQSELRRSWQCLGFTQPGIAKPIGFNLCIAGARYAKRTRFAYPSAKRLANSLSHSDQSSNT
jgi:hypothetical protein